MASKALVDKNIRILFYECLRLKPGIWGFGVELELMVQSSRSVENTLYGLAADYIQALFLPSTASTHLHKT